MKPSIISIIILFFVALSDSYGQEEQYYWYKYQYSNRMIEERVLDMEEDHLGYIWVMTSSNLYFLNEQGFSRAAKFERADASFVSLENKQGRLFAQTNEGSTAIYNSNNPKQSSSIVDREDSTIQWEFSPDRTLYRIQDSKKEKIDIAPEFQKLNNPISFNDKSKIIKSINGELWLMGDKGLLLYKFEKRIFKATKIRNIIKQITAYRKAPNKGRTIYLTSYAVKVVDDESGEIIKDIPIPEKYNILPTYDWFIKGNTAYIWAGFGVFEFDLINYNIELIFDPKFIEGKKINQTFCNFVTMNPDSTYLVLGAKGNLFYNYDLASKKLTTYELEAGIKDNSNIIFELDYISETKAIITSGKGIFLFDKKDETVVKMPYVTEQLARAGAERIKDLDVFQDSLVYFATLNKGFYIYDIQNDSVYEPINNIKDYLKLTNFVVDNEGDAWCGSSKGILHYRRSMNRLNLYDTKNGLFADDFYTNICHYTSEKIFFGQGLKYVEFDPNEVRESFNAKLNIQSLKINENQNIPTDPIIENGSIDLDYTQNNLLIEIGGSNYGITPQFQVEYKLLGLSDNWILAKDPESIQFLSLKPGKYEFQYKALGDTDNNAKVLSIMISQPFWTRTWVKYTGILLGAILLIGLYLYNIWTIKKRAFLQAEYERKIAKIQMDALRARMNPHFIFNSLNSIKSFIIENDSRSATRYLTKFAHLIRQILNNSKDSNISLSEELRSLELYIEIEKLRFNDSFTYEIINDTHYDLDDLSIPSMILQPIVENAIWHGLLHKKGDKHIQISIQEREDYLLATIEDNGVGRKKAAEMKSETVINKKSLGTEITSERLNLADKDDRIGSVEIIDLTDDSNNPRGTKVILKIPISQTN